MLELDFAARVDRGLLRETNQDVAQVVPSLGLAVVADGMGGHARGEVASRTAVDVFVQSFESLGGPGTSVDEAAQCVEESLHHANARVAAHQTTSDPRAKMGTTLVAAAFAHRRVVVAHVGDSRCYRLRDRRLDLLTQDHSYATHVWKMGGAASPSDREAVAASWGHVLTRCLNGEGGMTADLRIVRCEPGDVYLLCSDGLWGSVGDAKVATVLESSQDAEEACERLIAAALAGGGPDNIGAAVVRLLSLRVGLDKPPWAREQREPSDRPAGGA